MKKVLTFKELTSTFSNIGYYLVAPLELVRSCGPSHFRTVRADVCPIFVLGKLKENFISS